MEIWYEVKLDEDRFWLNVELIEKVSWLIVEIGLYEQLIRLREIYI
jgi:hypothetical protein